MAALSIEEKICIAGLAIVGKSFVVPGYLLCHPKAQGKEYDEKVIYSMASRWFNSNQAKIYRKLVATQIGAINEETGTDGTMSNADIMRELTTAARSESDFKKKGDLLLAVAKLKTTLEDQNPEEMRVHLYLPFNSDCRQCELYHRERERRNGNVEK